MKNIIIVLIILIALFLLFSSTDNKSASSLQFGDYSTPTDMGDKTYEAETSSEKYDTNSSLEFNGYECTVDCSGHEAGYEWAEEHGITQDDVDNYSGNSNSFMEGMQSYVDENY